MNSLQSRMFNEIETKKLFDRAISYGYEFIDQAFERHVFPTSEAIDNLTLFDEEMPAKTSNPEMIVDFLNQYGSPATVTQVGARYFGFVNGSMVPASLAAKLLADFWDQNTALQLTSPISAKLETVVEKWLKQLFGLPSSTVAGFVSGSSVANFCGLAAARHRILERHKWDVNKKGLNGAPLIRIVTSKQIHATVLKAIATLGLGIDNIEWVDVDEQGRIISQNIPDLDENTILVLQAGNVNSGAFDPFEEISEKAIRSGAWIHIDGAFGLWAAGIDRFKHLTSGIEKAHSWSVDGHKTLNTPYDCGIVMCTDREAMVTALQATGAYIEYGNQRDGMMFTPEMSRRARVIELWAALKYLGKEGIAEMINGFHQQASQFADELSQNGFEIKNDVVFNQVLVACQTDELTEATLKHLQDQRECWCGPSNWGDQKVIRISVCSWATTKDDVSRCVAAFVKARETALAPVR